MTEASLKDPQSTGTPSGFDVFQYNDQIVRMFLLVTILWGGVAFLLGLIVALQMAYQPFNINLEWLSFGRIRPLHTNAAIFAFAGNIIFAGIYHSTQRLVKARLWSDTFSKIHFWGWQAIIVGAAITLPLGFSQSKEYAELEWPLDIAIAAIWVIFGVNFFMTLIKRREKHIYVAIWFYIATIITVAVLHIVNSLQVPVGWFNSYPVFAGVQDALVQWWYGHNAVAFFLTTPFLGLMYYYIPKSVNRPIYSYRLSIIHFWALVFIYIWAGPHHLLYTALPDWAQTLGMIFSLMLWAPSWGGMINGLLTLRGAWNLLRTDPVVKFLIAAVTFYGMVTFEGPLLSIKSVNSLGHYTDWIIGHVHAGALGWNGFMAFGIIYYLVPQLWGTRLYSVALANTQFWVGLIGILLYYMSMIVSGITQGLMWRAIDDGGVLVYPDFVETVNRIVPLYWVRLFAGLLYFTSFVIFVYNIYRTIQGAPAKLPEVTVRARPLAAGANTDEGHRRLEGMVPTFAILTFLAIAVGSAIEILPAISMHTYIQPTIKVSPYTPLELAGRDIYVREGCYVCHSQMIRKMPPEVLRYGEASKLEESMWDRPFQWGSKRTGPDLARVGSKYPDLWHYRHMLDPRSVVPQSIMPAYGWLHHKKTDFYSLRRKLQVLKGLGVPYDDATVAQADKLAEEEAVKIAQGLKEMGVEDESLAQKEIVAIVAYLQCLGKKQDASSSSKVSQAGGSQ